LLADAGWKKEPKKTRMEMHSTSSDPPFCLLPFALLSGKTDTNTEAPSVWEITEATESPG